MDALENIVRTSDPDRYIAALFAPAEKRAHLFALYALNHELGHIAEAVREPMMAEIRLQWWRDALAEARAGKPRGHEVLQGMAKAFAAADIPQGALDTMIDARLFDSGHKPFADIAAMEVYADETAGSLMRIGAHILGQPAAEAAREAGIAHALTGILRAVPFQAARRKLYLPLDVLKAEGIDAEDVFAAREISKIKHVFAIVADRARSHLAKMRNLKSGNALPALMPAATVPFYLKLMTKRDFNPFRDRTDIPMHRRQIAMLAASLRGRP
jgi:phytoene/squalene synthetase